LVTGSTIQTKSVQTAVLPIKSPRLREGERGGDLLVRYSGEGKGRRKGEGG